jgi:ribulose-5-phosphate 4-epimerase/fuculose-1-phosphate aldolase
MSVFSEESLQLRRELAYACRILAANGQNDTIYGHVTYREAGAKTFWMKPAALGLDEITPETLIRVDLEGNIVEGELPRHLERPIHAELFRARPDITCVVHTHPCAGYFGYPFQKCVADGAPRFLTGPSFHWADGESVAHVAVSCSV